MGSIDIEYWKAAGRATMVSGSAKVVPACPEGFWKSELVCFLRFQFLDFGICSSHVFQLLIGIHANIHAFAEF